MSNHRISVRISQALRQRIAAMVRKSGRTESDIAREALEDYCEKQSAEKSAYDVFFEAGLIGDATGLPADFSTNPKYMEGFGRD
jgi:predicted transcriptional regulator